MIKLLIESIQSTYTALSFCQALSVVALTKPLRFFNPWKRNHAQETQHHITQKNSNLSTINGRVSQVGPPTVTIDYLIGG